MNYLVATTKRWNIDAFHQHTSSLPGSWHLISQPEQLSEALLNELQPAMIFFPHWSWKVPKEIIDRYPCVCFHMTALPFGRGGSPLQNLIALGYRQTQLSALLMTDRMDAGPVYAKSTLDLSGSAQQIFERAAPIVYQLIDRIITEQLQPQAQCGQPVIFTRRTEEQSRLPEKFSAEKLFDFIRMLDAETYPAAFLEYGDWRLEFSDAQRSDTGDVHAKVRFVPNTRNPL